MEKPINNQKEQEIDRDLTHGLKERQKYFLAELGDIELGDISDGERPTVSGLDLGKIDDLRTSEPDALEVIMAGAPVAVIDESAEQEVNVRVGKSE